MKTASKFAPGQLVDIDGKHTGEILHHVNANAEGDFWRVEVERADAEKHEYWTIHESRMTPVQPA